MDGQYNPKIYGDISAFANCTKLNWFNPCSTAISGDVKHLANLTKLANIALEETNITGDIANLSNLNPSNFAGFWNSKTYGDISAFSNWTKIFYLYPSGNRNLYGDISSLRTCINLRNLDVNNT